MEPVHRMRAARCERDVLDRLLFLGQVRTASIDTQQSTIKYLRLDGTTDRIQSFPMGSKVGDVGLGLGWYCAEVMNMYGEVLDPTGNADEDDTVVVRENSAILELPVAQELAAWMQMGLEYTDLPVKCQHLADIESRIAAQVRERMNFLTNRIYSAAQKLSNRQLIDSLGNILFNVRMAFLSYSAALHLHRGGDESDLDEFSTLIRAFMPNNRAQGEWMAVMLNAFQKSHIFPSTPSKTRKRRRRRLHRREAGGSGEGDCLLAAAAAALHHRPRPRQAASRCRSRDANRGRSRTRSPPPVVSVSSSSSSSSTHPLPPRGPSLPRSESPYGVSISPQPPHFDEKSWQDPGQCSRSRVMLRRGHKRGWRGARSDK